MQKKMVAVGPYCYGFGDSIEEAVKNCIQFWPTDLYYDAECKRKISKGAKHFRARLRVIEAIGEATVWDSGDVTVEEGGKLTRVEEWWKGTKWDE